MDDDNRSSRRQKMKSGKFTPRYFIVKLLQLFIAVVLIIVVVGGLRVHKLWKNINDMEMLDAELVQLKTIRDAEKTGAESVPGEIDITEAVLNYFWDAPDFRAFALPDKYCSVYIVILPSLKGEDGKAAHIEIRAEFPFARYMSWTNYLYGGGGLVDFVPDNLIQAGEGVNPLQKGSGGFEAAEKNPKNSYVLTIRDIPPDRRPSQRPENIIWGGYGPNGDPVQGNLLAQRVYAKHPLRPESEGHPDVKQWLAQGQVPMPRYYYVIDDPEKAPYKTLDDIKEAMVPHNNLAKLFVNAFVKLNAYYEANVEELSIHSTDVSPDRMFGTPEWVIGGAPNVLKAFLWGYLENPVLSRIAKRLPMYTPKISDTLNLEALYFPNWQTGYVAAHLNPEADDCYVFRFKARTTPATELGEPVNYGSWDPVSFNYGPDPEAYTDDTYDQLRYYSVSVYSTWLFALSDTLKDAELKVDSDGFITVVISSRDKKPSMDPVLGENYNWMEWGSPYPAVVIREMYAHPGFGQASYWRKLAIEQDRSPENRNSHYDAAVLKEHMGEYYPYGTYCSKEEFEANRGGLMPNK